MKINIEYKDGRMEVEGTPTEEERELYAGLKSAAGKFYESVGDLLEGTVLEGVLEIKVKQGGN